ncbi:MAG: TIGR02453 family protein [Muribaculaceae bacterium]|nr:TIGR02453 family protein [Muribaculaceae bacterium]
MNNIKELFKYLRSLSRNNNREWFNTHKDKYVEAKEFTDSIASKFICMVAEVEPNAAKLRVSDCTYRIYRDTRFSSDKTPYKTHFGIFVNTHGKKSETMGWYLHLEPGASMICAGTGWSSPKVLRAIRQGIFDEIDEYREIVESPEFKSQFPKLGEDCLKTAPKGFPKDWEFVDYLKPKMHGALRYLEDSFFDDDNWLDKLRPAVEQGYKFNRFYNYFIEEALCAGS